jgi:hypothetical protein
VAAIDGPEPPRARRNESLARDGAITQLSHIARTGDAPRILAMVKRLIIFAFVALAVGMAVPSFRARIVDTLMPIKHAIGNSLVPRRLDVMANQIDVRLNRGEGFPVDFQGWLRRDYSGSQFDPWDNLYYIETTRRDYTVGSMGADEEQGTEDDLTVTRRLPDQMLRR